MMENHRGWVRRALVVAFVYAIAGVGLGALAGRAGSHHMVVAWRLAAWIISAITFAAHIWTEGVRHGFPNAPAAFHAAVASALGAFGLAAAAALHSYVTSPVHPFPLISLIVWPLITGIPAFFVAYIIALVLRRTSRSTHA